MGKKKYIIAGLLILLSVAIIILAISVGNYMRQKKELKESMKSFSKLIESGNLDDVTLTIYYIPPHIDTSWAWRVDDLIRGCNPFVIEGNELEKHIDLLIRLNNTALKPVIKKSYLNARIYYVFETEKDGKILDAAMWSGNNNILVNEIEVKVYDILYDVIMPFLPEDVVIQFEVYLGRRNQDETINYSE